MFVEVFNIVGLTKFFHVHRKVLKFVQPKVFIITQETVMIGTVRSGVPTKPTLLIEQVTRERKAELFPTLPPEEGFHPNSNPIPTVPRRARRHDGCRRRRHAPLSRASAHLAPSPASRCAARPAATPSRPRPPTPPLPLPPHRLHAAAAAPHASLLRFRR